MSFGDPRSKLDLLTFVLAACACVIIVLRVLRRSHPEPWLRANFGVLALVVVAIGGAMADRAGEREAARLRQMLTGFAPTYAQELEQLGIADVTLDTPADDPTYLRLIAAQNRWLRANPQANDIYTFCRDADGRTRLLVDSETDYDGDGRYLAARERRTPIGELYPEAEPELDLAFAGQVVFAAEPVHDRWGDWVSAYAPIHDREGAVCAVVGVDYDAASWLGAIADRRINALCLSGVLLLVVLAAGAVVVLVRGEVLRRRRDQAALEAQARALERSNRDLARATDEARAATRAKSEFLANMSHEIRTPMTAILGFADLLLEAEQTDVDRQRCVTTIQRSGRHLLTLLNDILDLSKIEAGRLDLRPVRCSLPQIVDEVLQMFSVPRDEKALELAARIADDVPEQLCSDPTRLRQVLVNLVGNAVKFTERGSVVVEISLDGPADSLLRIDVSDTGIGMSAEQIGRLFQPFSQVDSGPARHHGGTGLGLSISRRLVEAMGGAIDVDSEPGRGSRFSVRLPLVPSPADGDSPAPELPDDAAGGREPVAGRVLLVDDGAENQFLIGHLLRKAGLDVEVLQDGGAAIERLLDADRPSVDLVVMDMMMPVLDGYEATRRLREAGFAAPIVALTAHALDAERARCLEAGCNAFITKPIERERLLDAVRGLLTPVAS